MNTKHNEKLDFNKYEAGILRLLYQTRAPLTTYEIARELQVSFPTIKKYLKDLKKEEFVVITQKPTKKGKVEYMQFNFSKLEKPKIIK